MGQSFVFLQASALVAFAFVAAYLYSYSRVAFTFAIIVFTCSTAVISFSFQPHPGWAYGRDFRSPKTVQRIMRATFGFVKLFEDPLTHDLIAVKFIDWDVSDGSSALFCEIDALSLVVHSCAFRIPRH
jgi:hypothetical protein